MASRASSDGCTRQRARDHLCAPEHEQHAPHGHELRNREVEAECEKQKGDAELSEKVNRCGLAQPAERVRPRRSAEQHIADDRRQPQSAEQRDGYRGEEQELDEFSQRFHCGPGRIEHLHNR